MIRADGEKLYANSGSLNGNALPQMLITTLRQAGRTFNDAETKLLDEAVQKAEFAAEKQDHLAAAGSLSRIKSIGEPGKLQSYSTLAKKADEIAAKVAESAEADIQRALEGLEDPDKAFEHVLFLVQAENAYEAFPAPKASVGKALRSVRRNNELAGLLGQAEALQRARRYAATDSTNVRKQAVLSYERVIQRFPGSEAEKIARQELAQLDPKSDALSQPAGTPTNPSSEPDKSDFRKWTDSTGKFEIVAKFVKVRDGKVTLETKEGRRIVLPLSRLSALDQRSVRERNQ